MINRNCAEQACAAAAQMIGEGFMSKQLENILQRQDEYVPKSARIPYVPISFVRGKGAKLYDCDGNEYIDFLASASSANIGHGNEEIAQAVYGQMMDLSQYISAYFPSGPMIDLAEKVSHMTGRPDMMVSFSCTGSASIDGAIKYARGYTGRPKIVSFSESYHGSTYGAISVSKLTNSMRRKIGPLLPECETFHYPTCLRCQYHQKPETCKLDCLEQIRYAFRHYLPADEVAAFLVEPIAGDAGLIVPPARFFQDLAALCRENGILLISDEINQGVGRTGRMFAMDNFGVECDLYVLGKSLGGGLPLGAVVGRREVMESLGSPAHAFTMSGNASCCTASLKMLEIMERENIFEESYQKGLYLRERFLKMQEEFPVIGEVRGIGLNIGVDLVTDRETMEKNYPAAAKISYYCMKHGLLLTFVGQSTLRVQPPLVITREELDRATEIIHAALVAYTAGELSDSILGEIQGW